MRIIHNCTIVCTLLNVAASVASSCIAESTVSFNADSKEAPKYLMRCSLALTGGVSIRDFVRETLDKANDTQAVYFVNSQLARVPAATFAHLPDLHLLNMRHSAVHELEPDAMRGLANLRILFLNNNNISHLPNGLFTNLTNLHTLHLSYNKLSSIDVTVFHGLTKLQSLHLDNNQIKSINNSAQNALSKLSYTSPQSNQSRQLASISFWRDPTAYMLYMHNKTASYILHQSDSYLNHQRQSSVIREPPWLLLLKVGYDTLNQISPFLFNTTQELIELWLNHNDITVIHEDSFVNLTDLMFLNLGHNSIQTIATGTFRDLSSLIYLDLSYNKLGKLQYGLFSGLSRLEIMNLGGNRITRLETNVLYPLTEIRLMNFSGNHIEKFDASKIIKYFENLKEINLNNNPLCCRWLTDTLHLFKNQNINLSPGISFKTNNVQGIQCVT